MPGYSPDQALEPDTGEEPCQICGELYECDEAAHRDHDVRTAMKALADLASLRLQTHNSGEGAPF